MKQFKAFFIIVIVLAGYFNFKTNVAFGDESDKTISETIDEAFAEMDLSGIENYYSQLPEKFTENVTLKDFLKRLISGDFADPGEIAEYCVGELTAGFKSKLPLIGTLLALLIISCIINALAPSGQSRGAAEIAKFAVYISIVCSVGAIAYSMLESGKNTIDKASAAIEAIFPVAITLMTITGSAASAAVCSPAAAFITDFAVITAKNVIFPVIVFMLVASVVSNVNGSVKLKGIIDFSSSALKWIIGLIVTIFSLFLTVNGLSAGMFDGATLRAVKYTLNSSVPIVGGLVKDGLDFILASSVLIKNSIGAFGIIFVFFTLLGPILEIAAMTLLLRLVGAVTEPLGDGKANEFISKTASAMNYLSATLIMIGFMYLSVLVAVIFTSQTLI